MKKRYMFLLIVITLIFITGEVSDAKTMTFSGRIIFFSTETVEIKKGGTERLFYITEKSVFLKDGKRVDRDSIALCQVAQVDYVISGGQNEIVRLTIIKESDCYTE